MSRNRMKRCETWKKRSRRLVRAGPTGRAARRRSKKRATLYVVSQLMKIYFKLIVKSAQPLIRPVEASAGKALESNSDFRW